MYEIEAKLAYDDKEKLVSQLKNLGAILKSEEEITDIYFSKDYTNLKEAKEFIRIRQKNGKAELTFKGETDSELKRIEINSDISDAEAVSKMFESMKFKVIRRNKTLREYWESGDIEIVIVQIVEPAKVDFAEVEGPSEELVKDFVNKLVDCVSPIGKDHFKALDS